MSKVPFPIIENHGGQSPDPKIGQEASFAYSHNIDFRKSPTSLTLHPKTTKESGSVVTGLITNMIQLPSGTMVGVSDNARVYSRSTGGTWTELADLSGIGFTSATGMYYSRVQDRLYLTDVDGLYCVKDIDGVFSGGSVGAAKSLIQSLDQTATDHTNIYTTTGSITETATHKLLVTPTIEPMYSLKVWVTTKGTGDLKITMHDTQNNKLAEITVANASLTNGQLNEFVFTTPVRNTVRPNASTYHFHITNPAGTASTIGCATASDFSTAHYQTWANTFVRTNNGWHPTINFLNSLLIGNGRYVAAWEIISQPLLGTSANDAAGTATGIPTNIEFLRHRVVLEPDYEVTSFALWGEYVAIAAEKRSTTATNEYQEGRIYLWDGVSLGWNTAIDVPEGSPFSLYSYKNVLYWFAGNGWYAWAGGRPVRLMQMPGTDSEFSSFALYTVTNPNMMAVRNGILLGGFPSVSNSSVIERAVYSYGSRDKNFKESFGQSYVASPGHYSSASHQLGMVRSFGSRLFISWKDIFSGVTSYGVDVVDNTATPFADGRWESLIYDFGRTDKQKEIVNLRSDFSLLTTGSTIQLQYKINREANWQTSTVATSGATELVLPINKRFREVQFALALTATTATPEILATTAIIETLASEAD